MKVWVVCECGYEDGVVELVGAFHDPKTARIHANNLEKCKDEEDDWLWYDVQPLTIN